MCVCVRVCVCVRGEGGREGGREVAPVPQSEAEAFLAAFTKRHAKPPENHAWIEYVALKMVAQAMTETKSTDSEKLIEYFEKGATFDILKARKAYFRAWDHQLVQEAYEAAQRAFATVW